MLTTGGTSMGASDLLKPVIERHLGGTIHFGRVKVKPGKPTTFATVPTPRARVPMFALPGNPASALVTFHVFVVPALRRLGGWPEGRCQLPRVKVQVRDGCLWIGVPGYELTIQWVYSYATRCGSTPARSTTASSSRRARRGWWRIVRVGSALVGWLA